MYKCIRVNLINFSLSNGYFNGFFVFYLTVHINVYVVLILFLSC